MPKDKKETALTTGPSADLIAELRANSGESSGSDLPFVPLIKVDNSKVEEKLASGRTIPVLCPPQLKRIDKVGEEYVETVMPNFGGIVLLIKWTVSNRGKYNATTKLYEDNDAPKFSSHYFDPVCLFGKKAIDIKLTDNGEVISLTYPEIKFKYGPNFKLVATLYVLFGTEVVRVVVSGSGRGSLFDYLKTIKQNDSISAHKTLFSAVAVTAVENPYNKLTVTNADDSKFAVDWLKVVEYQKELKSLFNGQKIEDIAEAVEGQVMSEEEIKVSDMKFD
jgi:hypothetical protein